MPTAKPSAETQRCPACGAEIKAARATRVQCPSCREIVTLGAHAPQSRIDELEERVAKLEQMLAEAVSAAAASAPSRLKWLASDAAASFTSARAEVLRHNLSTVQAHPITIVTPAGDERARERAEWFREVFEQAHWPVRGPEDAPAEASRRGLALATSLPVSPEAAATYLALRAAGFDLATAFDPELSAKEERLIVA